MSSKCFISNCDTNRHKSKKSMFKPRTDKMLKAWREILTEEKKELKKQHSICELHFKPEDIERERLIHKKGGIMEKEIRQRPILKEDAVPCIFSASLRPKKAIGDSILRIIELPVELKKKLREYGMQRQTNEKPFKAMSPRKSTVIAEGNVSKTFIRSDEKHSKTCNTELKGGIVGIVILKC